MVCTIGSYVEAFGFGAIVGAVMVLAFWSHCSHRKDKS